MNPEHPTPSAQHPIRISRRRTLAFAALGIGSWVLSLASSAAAELPKPKAEHVILCVWDGMRPDFITPELTPNLHALATRGTFFNNNHSFWITTTEVNGTVLATGAFPSRSTIIANREYRPGINSKATVATEGTETIRTGDAQTEGHYINALTVAEVVQQAGQRTVVAGTKPVALLHDRKDGGAERHGSVTLFVGKTYPPSYLKTLTDLLGPFPPYPTDLNPNTAQNLWTTRALTEGLWKDGVPRYSVLWLGDPDFSQHLTAPGHPVARAAIRDSDTHLGMVIEDLKKRDLLDKTDIFVVSDHGFSTVDESVNLVKEFAKGGINAVQGFTQPPAPGEVLVVDLGGSAAVYAIGKDAALIQKIVDVIQAGNFAGPVFTRDGIPGTFPFSIPHLDSKEAPDVVFSLRWRDGVNKYGAPGLLTAGRKPGTGTHGTLSKYDVRNTLVAGGPDIRAGFRNENPTGNIDVVPTILHLLGLSDKSQVDGRILTEALIGAEAPSQAPKTTRKEVSRVLPDGKTWVQYLQTTEYAGKTYFDQGNAETK